ncbi:hypothetical protein [Microbacterium yannicii]|uniref:hypothetical protein n=1 Tax=Microbacterium yannicii TaxID=671622 RepID=UPI00030986D2|nr:hypothetical protein [Microbacterium yannicii]
MNRIEITYGDREYIVAEREVAQVQREINASLAAGGGWLPVREPGERADVHLLITRGARIVLDPISDFALKEQERSR